MERGLDHEKSKKERNQRIRKNMDDQRAHGPTHGGIKKIFSDCAGPVEI
jgi:hypothetical protein